MNTGNTEEPTQWIAVFLLFIAGCTTAVHIGKVPSALPMIREVWQLSLTEAGMIVSLYSVLIATTGLLLGVVVQRVGFARFAVLGVALVGVGSFCGMFSNELAWMLFSRSVEGLGWIVAVIALPSMLVALSHSHDRALVMGIWGAFVPVGAGLMLLVSPEFLSAGGWQLSWAVAGVISIAGTLICLFVVHRHRERLQSLQGMKAARNYSDLRKPVVWTLVACFLFYSFQFVAVTSFLPTLLVETTSLSLASASRITAFVLMSNAIGNVAAGEFMRRGISHQPLLVAGALCMGVCTMIIFSPEMPFYLRIFCAFTFTVVSGLIPGALFATLPKTASSAGSVGLLIGLMMQCTGLGQLVGGVTFPAVIEAADSWQAAGYIGLLSSIFGAFLATRTALEPIRPIASTA